MKADDKSVETTELVLKVIDYAHGHSLDINNIDDVKKILEEFNTSMSTNAEIREFMVLLKTTDKYFEINAPKEKGYKRKLPN